jgi:FkbM family methyltransferase
LTAPADFTRELVFDVGMNNGDDTAHYLSKGYRVVAIEADPVLCSRANDRFAEAVRSEQLVVENVGIAQESGTATFYVNGDKSEFSAFDPEIAGRNGMKCHPVRVRAVTFEEMLVRYI